MWLILAFVSALLLGSYDVFKKVSVQENAVIPVILTSILFSSATLLPFLISSEFFPQIIADSIFFVPRVDFQTHLLFVVKAVIVLTSWLFAYFAMKHLPISIASPINRITSYNVCYTKLLRYCLRLSEEKIPKK